MPNWTENDLTVSGNIIQQDRMAIEIKTDENIFDFNKIIPYPEGYREQDKIAEEWEKEHPQDWGNLDRPKNGYNSGGYGWCCNNWGTKWNACETVFVKRDRSLAYFFNTAWSPPEPIIRKLSEIYPKLKFTLKYYEQGCGFSGKLVCKGGDVLEDTCNHAYRGHRGG
jgi:hypothetical protein